MCVWGRATGGANRWRCVYCLVVWTKLFAVSSFVFIIHNQNRPTRREPLPSSYCQHRFHNLTNAHTLLRELQPEVWLHDTGNRTVRMDSVSNTHTHTRKEMQTDGCRQACTQSYLHSLKNLIIYDKKCVQSKCTTTESNLFPAGDRQLIKPIHNLSGLIATCLGH